ncbi:VanZ family protein [Caproiciproducens sp. R2]|uniref:VanZ family protein n=1 Tax=Caproiciproducens sp. R2 TaxID=3435187 RepID=UPI0040340B30
MEKIETRQQILTGSLLAVYLLVMTWIILFKMQSPFGPFYPFRSINLIPFYQSVVVNDRIEWSEIYENVLIFVPFGLYISMLKSSWSFLKKVIPIFSVSFFYEAMQFILAVGASDITDLIGNTFGGILGIAVYAAVRRLLKTQRKANAVLNTIASVGTLLAVALLAFLTVSNL